MNRALLVIAKRPAVGQTKTRLTPPLSGQEAAALYEHFLQDTLELARSIAGVTRFINYWPPEQAGYFKTLAPDFELLPQAGDGLAARLDSALTRCLTGGFDQAVIMSSDSPTLPPAYLAAAFEQLNRAEVVLGPCEDGGYYLIGLTRPQPQLFREVTMSTPTVTRDTLAVAARNGLTSAQLPAWYDVDSSADFTRLVADLGRLPARVARSTRRCLRRFQLPGGRPIP